MVNKVILIGNLGGDPEIRYTQSGTPVASFSLATTERWKGQDGQMQEQTEWHNLTVWNKLAELAGEYLSKGSKVYIEGKLQTQKYTDKDGIDRYKTQVIAKEIKFLSPKQGGTVGDAGGYGSNGGGYPEPPDMGSDVPF